MTAVSSVSRKTTKKTGTAKTLTVMMRIVLVSTFPRKYSQWYTQILKLSKGSTEWNGGKDQIMQNDLINWDGSGTKLKHAAKLGRLQRRYELSR
jgi:hypothetical protein